MRNSQSQTWHLGVLIRDHDRNVMAAMCGPVMSLQRGVHPRIGACIQAITFALDIGFYEVVFEGPPVFFMGGLHDSSLEVTVEDMWLEEIPVLIQRFRHFTVALGSKEALVAVKELAMLGSLTNLSKVWFEEVLVEIEGVL